MRTKELIQACNELAKESFEWHKLKVQNASLSDEELQNLTAKGAWKKYLMAGGSRTMINKELSEKEDFGGQYDKMIALELQGRTKS